VLGDRDLKAERESLARHPSVGGASRDSCEMDLRSRDVACNQGYPVGSVVGGRHIREALQNQDYSGEVEGIYGKLLSASDTRVVTAKALYKDQKMAVPDICRALQVSRPTLYRWLALN
jgi:hypothetical protein